MSHGRYYIHVTDWMLDELGLTGNEVLTYAIVYGFSQDGVSEFKGTAQYIADRLHVRKATVLDILNRLAARGLIRKRAFRYEGHRYCFYSAIPAACPNTETVLGPGCPNTETVPGPNTETVPGFYNDNNKNNNKTPHTPQGAADGFDAFWAAYPNKTGKGAARTAWARAVKRGATLAEILPKLEALKESDQWQREDGRYIPNPATWLNQGRWEDDAPEGEEDGRRYL